MKRPRSSTFSLEGRLDGLPLRVSFSPAHPLADIFHPPHPPIASKSISWDVPLALTRAFRFPLPPFRGVAKAALYCAHPPNPLFPFKGSLVDPQMRASNEFTDDPSKLARYLFKGWGLIDLPLRATFSPARPLARRDVPLARARAFQSTSSLVKGVAKAALYCAHRTSTVSPCAFCEQEGHLAAPSPSF